MGRAGTKVGLSDPAVLDGKAVAQQIKGTPGITGLSPLSVHSGEEVWHLNTLGCYASNRVPKNRLITVDPSVIGETAHFRQFVLCKIANAEYEMQNEGGAKDYSAIPWEVATLCILHWQYFKRWLTP